MKTTQSVDSDSAVIGRRARLIRRRRGLSLDVAAGLAGVSKPYLSMLERGERRFERRGLIEDLASALSCSVGDLTGQPYSPPDRASAEALDTVPGISLALGDTTLDDVPDVQARSIDQLVRLVDQASDHCDQTRFALAGRGLGAVLTELHVHVVTGTTETRCLALAALVEACEVAFTITKYLGQSGVAVLAGRRGWDAAHQLDDPALRGFATYFRSNALMRLGERDRATRLLAATIDSLAPLADPTAPEPNVAQVYGMLHLRAALYAARDQRGASAHDHLTEAETLAQRTGERNALHLHFGPSNVAVWTVAVGVELEDGPAAHDRASAAPVDRTALGSANREATWHFDLARALAQAEGSRDQEVVRHLDTADQIAPVLIRNDPIARDLLAHVAGRARRRAWELDSLCDRFGLGTDRAQPANN